MSKTKNKRAEVSSIRINRADFSATHYNGLQFPSDMFYVGLANKILPVIHKIFSVQPGFSAETSKRMAITLACYVEDLVGGSGVWAAFTSLHKKKYGKFLPFYSDRDLKALFTYDDERPSFLAVLFLLWYVANEVDQDVFLNPNSVPLRLLAMALMPELTNAYDEAPETEPRPAIMKEEECGIPVFYQIRDLCTWLCERCYLTRINDKKKATDGFAKFLRELTKTVMNEEKSIESYALETFTAMNALIGPLAIPAYEWLSEIVSLYHEPEETQYIPILASIKSRPFAYYKYESVDEHELVLKDVDGKKYTLSSYTMQGLRFEPGTAPGKSIFLSIVFFDGVWLMNSISLQALPAEIYNEARKKHLEEKEQNKERYKYFMEALGKQRIGVFGSFEEYADIAFGANASKIEADPALIANIHEYGNMLYFIGSDGYVSIMPGLAPCIKIKDNPFYDKQTASDEGVSLIVDHELTSPEMRRYIIANKLIPDAALSSAISEEDGRKMFQRNIRFINDYSGRDTMTFIEPGL